MEELSFNDYWWVYLSRNSEWDRESETHEKMMKGHFAFIDDQIAKGNLFVAIPMSPSGGQYFFSAQITEEVLKELIDQEPSIGTVFLSEIRKAHVPAYHLSFTLEAIQQIDRFHHKRREQQR